MYTRRTPQQGFTLLESLIAMLIFSIGVLSIVGLAGTSVRNTAAAKYRTDASLQADQIIGKMWMGSKSNGNLIANYSSPSGAQYLLWKNTVSAALPVPATSPPTIAIDTNNAVTITIYWQAPGDASVHNYTTVARINE